jgi:hypothetical protein
MRRRSGVVFIQYQAFPGHTAHLGQDSFNLLGTYEHEDGIGQDNIHALVGEINAVSPPYRQFNLVDTRLPQMFFPHSDCFRIDIDPNQMGLWEFPMKQKQVRPRIATNLEDASEGTERFHGR